MKSWFMAFRPKTLTAAIAPVLVGTALAFASTNYICWWVVVCSLFSALFIQIGTNLVNDAMDFKKGADTPLRIGPQRVTQSGVFSYKQVMTYAALFFFLAVLMGIPLVIRGGWIIFLIGVVSIFCGYIYTSGPKPLAYQGLGDLFVILFFGLVAVGGVYFLHTNHFSLLSLVAGLQVGFLATAIIAINNLRDVEGDKTVGKKTLAVRWGIHFSRWEILVLLISPFILNTIWLVYGWIWAFLLPFLSYPLAFKLIKDVWAEAPGPIYNSYLARTAALHLVYGILLSLGLLLKV